jgi:hypothetical protein
LVRRPLFGVLYQPRMVDEEYGSVGGMRIFRGNGSTRRKPAPVPLRPLQISDDECGAVGGMRIGRGKRSIQRKPAPVPLCPPQIPHDITWDRTPAAAVGSRRLTA